MDQPASPLAKKLKLKPGLRAAVVEAPDGYLDLLAPPADVEHTWSAFGLQPYKEGEARQTFR